MDALNGFGIKYSSFANKWNCPILRRTPRTLQFNWDRAGVKHSTLIYHEMFSIFFLYSTLIWKSRSESKPTFFPFHSFCVKIEWTFSWKTSRTQTQDHVNHQINMKNHQNPWLSWACLKGASSGSGGRHLERTASGHGGPVLEWAAGWWGSGGSATL